MDWPNYDIIISTIKAAEKYEILFLPRSSHTFVKLRYLLQCRTSWGKSLIIFFELWLSLFFAPILQKIWPPTYSMWLSSASLQFQRKCFIHSGLIFFLVIDMVLLFGNFSLYIYINVCHWNNRASIGYKNSLLWLKSTSGFKIIPLLWQNHRVCHI